MDQSSCAVIAARAESVPSDAPAEAAAAPRRQGGTTDEETAG
ncbi:hypothetical protein GCM10010377_41520 [Streptomyces viridiviolaceus]|uniref:Uncharacterized protein n=1 Tax=Streptomyces viridiviolaceus TaxID=68282 RepID=A0ABW2E897_9ACTN|nr:hypothetical protein [Streptomyces viridiviolaceus]GHB46342.1 hypothetical protein GCM10010377_41520 [Streptomyces viridiviolaceus]